MADLFVNSGEYIPDKLIVSNEYPVMTEGVVLASGQGIIKRGSLIGKVADKGYLTGTTIGEATAGVSGILTDDVDTGATSTADTFTGTMYITGCFNEDALTTSEGATIDKTELRRLGIYLITVQNY